MLPLKAMDITKSVVVAIIASLLCMFIFLPSISNLLSEAMFAIGRAWVTERHAKLLVIIYGNGVADAISYGASGLLMGVFIGFVSKNNRILTTILALLIVTIIAIIYSFEIIPKIPQDYRSAVLIRLGISFLLSMVFFWGGAFLGILFFARRKRKTGQQRLPGEKETCANQ
jgi:hypothetical protein